MGIKDKLQKLEIKKLQPDFTGLDLLTAIETAQTDEERERYEKQYAEWLRNREEPEGDFSVLDAWELKE